MRSHTMIVGAAAAVALGAAASAQTVPEPRDALAAGVFALEVDLQSEAGAQGVLDRIRLAARASCGEAPAGSAVARNDRRLDDCVSETVDRAVRLLGDPRVARLHRDEPRAARR